MIEERLGRPWADWAVRAVTLTIYITPAIFILTFGAIGVAVALGAWGWAFDEFSSVAGRTLASIAMGIFVSLVFGVAITRGFFEPRAQRALDKLQAQQSKIVELNEEGLAINRDARRAVDDMNERHAELQNESQLVQRQRDEVKKLIEEARAIIAQHEDSDPLE